jgi:hypothetical protein
VDSESAVKLLVAQTSQATEKTFCAVILSEAKNLSLFFLGLIRREILRSAQNDKLFSFSQPLPSVIPLSIEDATKKWQSEDGLERPSTG